MDIGGLKVQKRSPGFIWREQMWTELLPPPGSGASKGRGAEEQLLRAGPQTFEEGLHCHW